MEEIKLSRGLPWWMRIHLPTQGDYMKILLTIKDFECVILITFLESFLKLSRNVQTQIVLLGNSTKHLKKDHTCSA